VRTLPAPAEGRGSALRCHLECPATRDAGERPRCTLQPPSMHVPEVHVALQLVSLASPYTGNETSQEALRLSGIGVHGDMQRMVRSACQTFSPDNHHPVRASVSRAYGKMVLVHLALAKCSTALTAARYSGSPPRSRNLVQTPWWEACCVTTPQ
jgi:hypothetical protein